MDCQSFRKDRRNVLQPLTRPRCNDERRDEGNLRRAIPASKAEKRVGADQREEMPHGKLGLQTLQCVDRVVRFSGWVGSIHEGNREIRKPLNREFRHGDPILKGSCRAKGLQRLDADWRKQHGVELQGRLRGPGYADVPEVGRIETATEKGYATSPASRLLHAFMLPDSLLASDAMRYVIATLALAGVVVSGLALQVHYSVATSPCSINEKWDCGIVNHSSYSMIEGIPVALIGIAGYLALIWLAIARQRVVLILASLAGLAFSLYLAHIERDVLLVWCLYCVISLALIAVIVFLGILWVIIEASNRRASRW